MLFNSITFLFYFLPLLIITYYVLPRKFRNFTLLLSSLLFYAWGGFSYTLILILSIAINYFFVKRIELNDKGHWLIIGISFNVLLLIVFKYLDFIIENINFIGLSFHNNFSEFPLLKIVLPLGISFFTFQQMSLLWDVSRGENIRKSRFSSVALYISLFPQLIAGPIVRYHDIVDQINQRKESLELFRSGISRFILGLFKKVVIANTFAQLADSIMDLPVEHLNSSVAWLGIIAYAFQIYFDFSGYSDMAIGLGRMFGFRIAENFNFPYISKSIQEFWRRWHISLSTWFRDYVYIPLGGNRKGAYRTYFNLTLVFLLTGFWHGATWSFIVWGLFHGLFLIIEKLGFNKILEKLPNFFSWSYTILIVLIAWVLFRIENISDAISYIFKLFTLGGSSQTNILDYVNNEYIFVFILAFFYSIPFSINTNFKSIKSYRNYSTISKICSDTTLVVMFVLCVMYINSGSYSPFIYFRF